MKYLEPFEFTPNHQPDAEHPVSFSLRPLDPRGKYEIQASFNERGIPEWSGIQSASRYIVGWKGDALGEYSRARVRQLIEDDATTDWILWFLEISGKLFSASVLTESEEKKS